jgi:hypothetical protein
MSELCATLDTTQDAAHFACGTSYGLVRKGKTDEAAHSSVPPRRPARTVRVAEHLPETTHPRRASRAIRHEVDDGATPSRPTWDPGRDFARGAATPGTCALAPATSNDSNFPAGSPRASRRGGRGEAGEAAHARRATARDERRAPPL